jgi:hypothetical protein
MKEVHIKVSHISQKQWTNLLIELNLIKNAWQRFGPEINIKAKNFDRIIKWGRKRHGQDTSDIDSTFQRHTRRGKIRF